MRSCQHWSPAQSPVTRTLAHQHTKREDDWSSKKINRERKYVVRNNQYRKSIINDARQTLQYKDDHLTPEISLIANDQIVHLKYHILKIHSSY